MMSGGGQWKRTEHERRQFDDGIKRDSPNYCTETQGGIND